MRPRPWLKLYAQQSVLKNGAEFAFHVEKWHQIHIRSTHIPKLITTELSTRPRPKRNTNNMHALCMRNNLENRLAYFDLLLPHHV
jgi:hypothetical protein